MMEKEWLFRSNVRNKGAGMECQICGSMNIEITVGKEEFTYKGSTLIIDDYKRTVCHNCGESTVDNESYERSIPLLRDFHRSVDGYLTGDEIKCIRKSFNMTQDEFSSVLGGGEKAFARYETGRVMQSKPMDNLLRILKVYPEAISVLGMLGKERVEFKGQILYTPIPQHTPFKYVIQSKAG